MAGDADGATADARTDESAPLVRRDPGGHRRRERGRRIGPPGVPYLREARAALPVGRALGLFGVRWR